MSLILDLAKRAVDEAAQRQHERIEALDLETDDPDDIRRVREIDPTKTLIRARVGEIREHLSTKAPNDATRALHRSMRVAVKGLPDDTFVHVQAGDLLTVVGQGIAAEKVGIDSATSGQAAK